VVPDVAQAPPCRIRIQADTDAACYKGVPISGTVRGHRDLFTSLAARQSLLQPDGRSVRLTYASPRLA